MLLDKTRINTRVRNILGDPGSDGFLTIAALVISHDNDPDHLLKEYLAPKVFLEYWPAIRQKILKNDWGKDRIAAWEAIYRKLSPRGQGKEELCLSLGKKIASLRRRARLSQKGLAGRMGVSQQLISRIESGGENVSYATLANIAKALRKRVKVDFIK